MKADDRANAVRKRPADHMSMAVGYLGPELMEAIRRLGRLPTTGKTEEEERLYVRLRAANERRRLSPEDAAELAQLASERAAVKKVLADIRKLGRMPRARR